MQRLELFFIAELLSEKTGFEFCCEYLSYCCLQDSVVMERLIEKYMSLPNQAWDNIVKEATRVSNSESS